MLLKRQELQILVCLSVWNTVPQFLFVVKGTTYVLGKKFLSSICSSSSSFPNTVRGSWKPTVFRSCQRLTETLSGTLWFWVLRESLAPTLKQTMQTRRLQWFSVQLLEIDFHWSLAKLQDSLDGISIKQTRPPTWLLCQNC